MRTMTKTLRAVVLALSATLLLAACGYGNSEGGGSSGGGNTGGGVENPKESVCDAAIDLVNNSVTRQCEEDYWWCCYCVCWNNNQYFTDEDNEYCYCKDPDSGQVYLELADGCTAENLAWAHDLQENQSQDAEADGYLGNKCSSGSSRCGQNEFECACGECIDADYVCDGDPDCNWACDETPSSDEEDCGSAGGSNDCHSTGRLKCSSGYLWSVLRCDDGTEKLSSENFYECPCGCYHGSSTCNMC